MKIVQFFCFVPPLTIDYLQDDTIYSGYSALLFKKYNKTESTTSY